MEPEVKLFASAVGAIAPEPGDPSYYQFRQIFRRQSYFILKNKFAIIKISRTAKPFWGLTKTYVDFLNGTENYLLILLTSANEGYCFPKVEINRNIESGRWGLTKGQYKINPPLPDRNFFYSTDNFLKKHATKPAEAEVGSSTQLNN